MANKQAFEMPFIGMSVIDGVTLLYTQNGNYSAILTFENYVPQFSANADLYVEYHQISGQIIKILGSSFILQKTDIIAKKEFSHVPNPGAKQDYLDRKFFEYFQ